MDSAARIAAAVGDFGPVRYTLGPVKVFPGAETGKPYDVLYAEVDSPDAHRLRAALSALPHTPSEHPFRPHCTIAYVKAGTGAKYAARFGSLNLSGAAPEMTFSTADRRHTTVPLAAAQHAELVAHAAAHALAGMGCPAHLLPTPADARAWLDTQRKGFSTALHPHGRHGWFVPTSLHRVSKKIRRHGARAVAVARHLAERAHQLAHHVHYHAVKHGLSAADVLDTAEDYSRILAHKRNWLTDHLGVGAHSAAVLGSHLLAHAFTHARRALKRHFAKSVDGAMSTLALSEGGALVPEAVPLRLARRITRKKLRRVVGAVCAGLVDRVVGKSWDASKHPRGNPENPGEFAPKGAGGGGAKAKTREKEEPDDDRDDEDDADEEWDGEIDQDAVEAGSDIRSIDTWSSWDGGDETENEVYLVGGTFTTPAGDDVDVYRWESRDPDGDVTDSGEWTESRSDALSGGVDHARQNHAAAPDPEDDDIDDVSGESWSDRDVIGEYTTSDDDDRTVRLETGTFEFAGREHTCYRWTTRYDDDGDWTLDRRQAVRDGKAYAEDAHNPPDDADAGGDVDIPDDADAGGDVDIPDAPPKRRPGVTLTGEDLPKSSASVSVAHSVHEPTAARVVAALFGTEPGPDGANEWDRLAEALGMPDDAAIKVVHAGKYDTVYGGDPEPGGVCVRVEVSHPAFNGVSRRSVGIDPDGRRYIVNHGLFIKDARAGAGLGVAIFSRQVEAACQHGFDYIATHAAKGPEMNGYATWPKFGYDQPVSAIRDAAVRVEVGRLFPEAKTVLDVLAAPGGEEWWCGKRNPDGTRTPGNGTDLYDARFDLDPGSRSVRVLANYLRRKKGGGDGGRDRPDGGGGGGPGRGVGGVRGTGAVGEGGGAGASAKPAAGAPGKFAPLTHKAVPAAQKKPGKTGGFTPDEAGTLRDLMLHAAESGDRAGLARLKELAGDPQAYRAAVAGFAPDAG